MLFGLLETARAWERLHDPDHVGTLDADGYLALCLAAGFSEDEAQKWAEERANARMREGLEG